jgi:hypothetical protein
MVGNVNLILGLAWLAIGVWMLWADYTGQGLGWRIRFFPELSVGWLLLVLALYNFVRWYSIRAGQRARAEEERAAWLRRAPRRRDREDVTPDPNFQFTDEPPPPDNLTDRPPPES